MAALWVRRLIRLIEYLSLSLSLSLSIYRALLLLFIIVFFLFADAACTDWVSD